MQNITPKSIQSDCAGSLGNAFVMEPFEKSSEGATKKKRLVDIAALAGVSRITVQKVLFPGGPNNTRVSKETAERIKAIATEMNYLPNFSARHLAGKKSRLIGVTIDSFAPDISFMVLNLLERCASSEGYRLIIGQVHEDIKAAGEYLTDFAGRGVDGLIVFAHDFPGHLEQLGDLYKRIKNVVFIGEPRADWADWVGVDIAEGVRIIVRHLVETGRRNIVLHMSNGNSEALRARVRGFQEALAASNLSEVDCPIRFYDCSGQTPIGQAIDDSLTSILRSHPHTQAIISVNDLMAMYTIRSLNAKGVSCPEEIAVTGFDNMEFGSVALPSITSVDQLASKVAKEAMAKILSRVSNPFRAPEKVLIEPSLVVRRSTDV